MTRCKEFYDKVERDGFDWCEKDKGTVSRINSYLKVVNELSDEGIEKKLTYGNFSENASRPLNKIEDSDIRGEVISLIAKSISRGDQPSEADVKVWIDLAEGRDPMKRDPLKKQDPTIVSEAKQPEPENKPIAPSPTITPATVAAIAHVPEEKVIPAYTPPAPIERTDPDDHANGVVKRDWNSGNDIPDVLEKVRLTGRTKAVMRQLVRYHKALDYYLAFDYIIAEGIAKCEDICEIECLKESAEA